MKNNRVKAGGKQFVKALFTLLGYAYDLVVLLVLFPRFGDKGLLVIDRGIKITVDPGGFSGLFVCGRSEHFCRSVFQKRDFDIIIVPNMQRIGQFISVRSDK